VILPAFTPRIAAADQISAATHPMEHSPAPTADFDLVLGNLKADDLRIAHCEVDLARRRNRVGKAIDLLCAAEHDQ
jgi:hypothetical protein